MLYAQLVDAFRLLIGEHACWMTNAQFTATMGITSNDELAIDKEWPTRWLRPEPHARGCGRRSRRRGARSLRDSVLAKELLVPRESSGSAALRNRCKDALDVVEVEQNRAVLLLDPLSVSSSACLG